MKIPRNMELFKDQKDSKHLMETGLRAKLLSTAEDGDADAEAIKNTFEGGEGPKLSLGKLIQKIKESQRQGDDDNFRA